MNEHGLVVHHPTDEEGKGLSQITTYVRTKIRNAVCGETTFTLPFVVDNRKEEQNNPKYSDENDN